MLPTMKEGYSSQEKIYENRLEPDTPSFSVTLTELSKEFTFVNCDIFTFSGLTFNPLDKCIADFGLAPYYYLFSRISLILGLGSFFNRVAAVKTEYWEQIKNYIGMTTIVDRSAKIYLTPILQKVPIVDFAALSQLATLPEVVPTVDLYLFGLSGNKNCWHFKPRNNSVFTHYVLTKDEPFEETKILAEAIFSENDKPFTSLEGK